MMKNDPCTSVNSLIFSCTGKPVYCNIFLSAKSAPILLISSPSLRMIIFYNVLTQKICYHGYTAAP